MNTPKTLLSLTAALIAAPLMSQELAAGARKIRFDYDATDADFAVVLVAADDAARSFGRHAVLDHAAPQLVLVKTDGRFVLDAELPDDWKYQLYVQGITCGHASGFRIGPIVTVEPQKPAPVAEEDAAPATLDAQRPAIQAKPDQEPGDVDPGEDHEVLPGDEREDGDRAGEGGTATALGPIELEFEDGDPQAGTTDTLRARFVAKTDGYDLLFARVAEGNDGWSTDVFLYRKLPGKGEGMRDVVEEHVAETDVPGEGSIRVFLAEGTAPRPEDGAAWKLLTKLSR